jgi:hypothetical protein
MQPWHHLCLGNQFGGQQMTKDILAICVGMLVVGVGVWSFRGNSQSTMSAKTDAVRILADDPALKLVSEKSDYMRTER